MMQEVEVLKTIPELVCSYFSEEQFTLSIENPRLTRIERTTIMNLFSGRGAIPYRRYSVTAVSPRACAKAQA